LTVRSARQDAVLLRRMTTAALGSRWYRCAIIAELFYLIDLGNSLVMLSRLLSTAWFGDVINSLAQRYHVVRMHHIRPRYIRAVDLHWFRVNSRNLKWEGGGNC